VPFGVLPNGYKGRRGLRAVTQESVGACVNRVRPKLGELLGSLYEKTSEADRSLVADIEASIRETTVELERERRFLDKAARLYRAERDILRLIVGISTARDGGQPSQQTFVREAVNAIGRMPRVEHGCVVLFDDDGRPSILETIRVDEHEKSLLLDQISRGIVARVRNSGEEIYCEEAAEDAVFGGLRSVQTLKMQTVLCCPIMGDGDGPPRGAVYIENRSQVGAFPDIWRRCVRLLADQMARQLAILERGQDPGEDPTAPFRKAGRYREFIGSSLATARLMEKVDQLASYSGAPPTVMLIGETGVGKDLTAQMLHRYGPRAEGPFVPVNAATLQPSLAESELFGTVNGAFTGAQSREGVFHEAHGGILFLDEVGELPPEVQAKLLRVLDDHRVRRVGGKGERTLDVWVIVATNADLEKDVDAGRFRRDLYYRLAQEMIYIPPLRERPEDTEELAKHFLAIAAGRRTGPAPFVSPDLIMALRTQPWPGNVRELQHLIERMMANARQPILTSDDLRRQGFKTSHVDPEQYGLTWDKASNEFRARYLRWAIETWGSSQQELLEHLGIHRTTFYKLCRRHQIDIPDWRAEAVQEDD